MLTKTQQQLAAQYNGAIFSFCKEYHLNYSEWYGLLAIALCEAAQVYDPNRGTTFLALAYQCMRYRLRKELTRLNRKKRIPRDCIVSYNRLIEGRSGHATEYLDRLYQQSQSTLIDVTAVEVNDFRNSLSDTHRFVLDGLMDGMREREIAAELGYTASGVSWIKQQLKKKWQSYCAA